VKRTLALWWVLAGVGLAGWVALLTAIYLYDLTPSHLLFAALGAYSAALSLARMWIERRSGSDSSHPSR
jgi:hypothetical protein